MLGLTAAAILAGSFRAPAVANQVADVSASRNDWGLSATLGNLIPLTLKLSCREVSPQLYDGSLGLLCRCRGLRHLDSKALGRLLAALDLGGARGGTKNTLNYACTLLPASRLSERGLLLMQTRSRGRLGQYL